MENGILADRNSVTSHLEDLHSMIRRAAFVFLIASAITTIWIETILYDWALSQSPSGALSVYGPYDWIEMRFMAVIIIASVFTLPFFSLDLRFFANTGLLPNEKRWLDSYLILNAIIVPGILYWVWFSMIPYYIQTGIELDSITSVVPRYDASEIFALASGISWILILTFTSTLFLSLSRLFGLVEEGRSRFRTRVYGILGGLLILTLPEIFEGLRILIAISVLVIAEVISRTVPEGPLGLRNPSFTPFTDKDGQIQRIALVDCSCEGACPSFNENWLQQKIPILRPSALCLDENEQIALREMMLRNSLNRLTITGCNGYPLPVDIRSMIESNQTQLDGLNWLDEAKSESKIWRKQSLQYYSAEYRELP